jgi:hypothetical protein
MFHSTPILICILFAYFAMGIITSQACDIDPPVLYSNTNLLSFNGINEYFSVGRSIVPADSASYTISMWVYRNRNNVGFEELLSQWTYPPSGFFFGFNGDDVRFTA